MFRIYAHNPFAQKYRLYKALAASPMHYGKHTRILAILYLTTVFSDLKYYNRIDPLPEPKDE